MNRLITTTINIGLVNVNGVVIRHRTLRNHGRLIGRAGLRCRCKSKGELRRAKIWHTRKRR
jgi:hypothetical protein